MKIHQNFIGGNITVEKQNGNTIYLKNQLRDTTNDWFYWAFCVEEAQNSEVTFVFEQHRVGYFGPAVSHDLKTWHWLGSAEGESFRYKFGENESKVYFAHSFLYHPTRFEQLAKELSLNTFELCKSPKGRSVPAFTFGNGDKTIILTARHHACESTGSYVLEGVIREFCREIPDGYKIMCVPFMDYDGVTDGDQGKARAPHDHNRDYAKDVSIYPETEAVKKYADENGCRFGFDFHSPWHLGGENDYVFVVRNTEDKIEKFNKFSEILEREITPSSMKYFSSNDHQPNTGWNKPCNNFSYTMNQRSECELAFTLETTYFGTKDDIISEEKMLELGKCFAKAVKKYILTLALTTNTKGGFKT